MFCTPGFGDFLLLFSSDSLKLCRDGYGPPVNGPFHVSPRGLNGFKSSLRLGHTGVLCFGCVLRVIGR